MGQRHRPRPRPHRLAPRLGRRNGGVRYPLAVPACGRGGPVRLVPFGRVAWLAGQVPGARAHLLPGEGHLTLISGMFGSILDDLLDLAGQARPT